jgi:hypothetical protein
VSLKKRMSENLEDKILKWIGKEGYPLELKATQILRKIGFIVGQSINYLDSESNDIREIDIVAYKYYKVNEKWVTFSFVIECKSSLDKPWIAFTSKEERLYPDDYIIHRNANNDGKRFLKKMSEEKELKDLELFKLKERTSYNLIRAFTDGVDVTYKALMSATKATNALVEKGNKTKDVYRFFFPLILINSKLFDCHLDLENEIKVSEINSTKLVVSNSFDSQRANFIDLVTLDYFEQLMSEYYNNIEFIIKEFESEFE